ncbi:hypothetical protein ACIQZB_38150 [Streptomyces sp. NPDC097727]|uniref:hypothetical protein n=1 Tax=Streptomyces sp. NPDC097727 TaxID=3366092 RepID=UPI00382640B1
MAAAVRVWDEMSDSTKDLLFAALDYAVENAGISEYGFTPFSIRGKSDGTRGLTRFVAGDDLAESVRAGRKALEVVPEGTVAVTLAWDGYTTYEGQRTEAVFVEAHEISLAKSVLLAQRYLRVDGKVETLGNPIVQGETDPLVRAVSVEES